MSPNSSHPLFQNTGRQHRWHLQRQGLHQHHRPQKILARDLRPFARHLVILMAEYAKGRKLIPADYPAIETILDRSAANDFRLQDMLLMVITGQLMRMR